MKVRLILAPVLELNIKKKTFVCDVWRKCCHCPKQLLGQYMVLGKKWLCHAGKG